MAQFSFSRIEANFLIKEVNANGTQKLTMGKVFFDLRTKQLLYQINFPTSEIIIMKDTIMYQVKKNKLVSQKRTGNIIDFTIFNLALQGELPYFGIKKTGFTFEKVENENGMVISTWNPPLENKEVQGKVIISQKKQQLFGMISFSPTEEIIAKQFFRKYDVFQGLSFPTEVLNFTYFQGKESKKITTYKNVQINNYSNNTYYQYQLPSH